ncbi:MAG: hypothetical protein IPM97_00185 [Bdellovibrionaceae bacterium]|nr:hypothetical protein [Pseudobdellovibrionaceae bacterium]
MTELQRLELLDSLIWMNARNALTALATEHYLNHQFYGLPEDERRKAYKTNVANTFPYQANDAVIDTSVVKIVEHYKSEDKMSPLPLQITDIEELRKHRIIISHPANAKFSDPDVQKFYDAGLHYKDPKAIRLWRVREAIIQKLTELGSTKIYPNEMTVQLGTVELIHGVISSSLAEGQAAPPLPEVAKSVYPYFKKYEEAIRRFAAESS